MLESRVPEGNSIAPAWLDAVFQSADRATNGSPSLQGVCPRGEALTACHEAERSRKVRATPQAQNS